MKPEPFWKRQWFIAIFLFAFVVLIRIPSIEQPLDNDSGAIAYHARLILQGEPLYGTHHPNHHLPASYYTYAFIFHLLGDRPESLKIVLIGWVWLTGWVVFLIGKKISGLTTGLLAAIFFVLTSSMTNLAGDSAEIELWANLPLTLTIWLGIVLRRNRYQFVGYILVGMLGAITFLFKAVYLSSLATICACLFLDSLLNQKRKKWICFLKQILVIISGCLLILVPVGVYFASVGVWDRLLLIFQMGSDYVQSTSFTGIVLIFVTPLFIAAYMFLLLTLFGIISFIRIVIQLKRTILLKQETGVSEFLLAVWFFTSIVAAGFSTFPFPHYVLLILPPISILCAYELPKLFERQSTFSLQTRSTIYAILSILVIGNILLSAKPYLQGYYLFRSGQISYREFILEDVWTGKMNIEAEDVAKYIRQNSSPDDKIFCWAIHANIYYMADRRSSSEFLWPAYFKKLPDPERIFTMAPAFIVYDPKIGEMPDWLSKNIAKFYKYDKTIDGIHIFRYKPV